MTFLRLFIAQNRKPEVSWNTYQSSIWTTLFKLKKRKKKPNNKYNVKLYLRIQ